VKSSFIVVLVVCCSILSPNDSLASGPDFGRRLLTKKASSLQDRLNGTDVVTVGRRADPSAGPPRAGIHAQNSLSTQRVREKTVSLNPSDGEIIEEYGEVWNGSAWENYIRWLYTYDSAGNFVQEVRQYWSGSAWVNQARWTMEYDENGYNTTELRQYWVSNMWANDFMWFYSYDSTGLWIGELIQTWQGTNWANYSRWTYTYNGNGDFLEELQETWNGSMFVNLRRYTSTYSVFLDRYASDHWNGSMWVPDYRIDYTHDGNGNFLTETRQDWNGSGWDNSWKYTNTYDLNDNDISWLYEVWVSGWLLSDLDSLYYDVNNSRIGWLHKYYDAGWINSWKGDFSYYPNGDWMEDIWYDWNGSAWVNDWRYYPVWKGTGTAQMYPVQDKWNMVSVPLTLSDYTATSVFPNAVSSAFEFTTMYSAAAVLENGPGYWVKFDGAQNVSMTGIIRAADTFAVASGWNMIGSIGGPVDVSSITSDPPGLVTSSFFGFTNMYQAATMIEPGKAYWVKVSGPGNLMLSKTGGAPPSARIRIVPTDELPPAPHPGSQPAGIE